MTYIVIFSEEDEVVGMDILDEVGVNLQVGGAVHNIIVSSHMTTSHDSFNLSHDHTHKYRRKQLTFCRARLVRPLGGFTKMRFS